MPDRRTKTGLAALIMLIVAVGLIGPSTASAQLGGTGVVATPEFPPSVTVGAQDVPVQLRLINVSTGEYADDNFQLSEISLTPSCGSKSSFPTQSDCPVGSRDPGVLVPSATAVGVNDPTGGLAGGGTACAGRTFTLTVVDATQGKYAFVPDQPVVLGPTNTVAAICVIQFTIDAAKAPTIDSDPAQTAPGPLQTDQKAFAFGTSITQGNTFNQEISGGGTDETTVLQATPTITTAVSSPAISLGGGFTDTAIVSGSPGGPTPTGTVTFVVYGPGDVNCEGAPVAVSPNRPLSGGTTVSDVFTPTTPGEYRVIAIYNGDANYVAFAGLCNAANEMTTVSAPATPPPPGSPPPPPPPPAQQVAAETSAPSGTAAIKGPTGCVYVPFNVIVSGRQILRVVFARDGKAVRTLTRPNSGTRYKYRVNAPRLLRGTHRVTARVIFRARSNTRSRTLRVVFSRCARRAAAPTFTG